MKKNIFTFVIAAGLALAPSVLAAETREFSRLTVEVPDNWAANEDDKTVYIVANDGSSIVSVMIDKFERDTAAKLAKEMARQFKAEDARDLGNGNHAVNYIEPTTGKSAVALISQRPGQEIMVITQIGDNEAADNIIGSLKPKDTKDSAGK